MSYPTEGRKKKKQAKNGKKKEARKYKKGPGKRRNIPSPSRPIPGTHNYPFIRQKNPTVCVRRVMVPAPMAVIRRVSCLVGVCV
jgi:hypothetical protein